MNRTPVDPSVPSDVSKAKPLMRHFDSMPQSWAISVRLRRKSSVELKMKLYLLDEFVAVQR